MGIFSNFFLRKNEQSVGDVVHNYHHLDASFDLLRKTTEEVADEAAKAAVVLSERLALVENRFEATIDSIGDFVAIKDGAGRWKIVNAAGRRLLGITNEYIGKTNEEIAELVPGFELSLQLTAKTSEQAWTSKAPVRSMEIVSIPGKPEIFFDVIKTPTFNKDGSRKELIVIGRDVTELREEEQMLRVLFTALDGASNMILILKDTGEVVFANKEFKSVYGADNESIKGKHICQLTLGKKCAQCFKSHAQDGHAWTGLLDEATSLSLLPIMNGKPNPVYFIATLNKI